MAAELALRAARWPSMTQRRLAVHVDAIVARADALRRQKKTQADRNLDWAQPRRVREIAGSLLRPDTHALDEVDHAGGRQPANKPSTS